MTESGEPGGGTAPARTDDDAGAGGVADRVEFLLVRVAGERLALESGRLRRVVPVPTVTRVPRAPDVVAGVAAVDGETVVVVDARTALGTTGGAAPDPKLVLLERERDGEPLGLVVDAVESFETVPVSRISLGAEADLHRARLDGVDADADVDPDPDGDGRPGTGGTESYPVLDVDALFGEATADTGDTT